MSSKTVFDAYSSYLEVANDSAKSMLKSILVRFLVPQWGGQVPKGSRATPYEVMAAEEVLRKTPIKFLIGSNLVLEEVFELKNVDENRKSFRSFYKKFLGWAEENNYFSVQQQETKPEPKANLFTRTEKFKRNHHGTDCRDAYALMCSTRGGKLVYEDDYINKKLKVEIEQFQKFRRENNCSTATVKKDTIIIHRKLGWLHRYKGIPLETLSLTNIISYQKLCVSFKECLNSDGSLDMNNLFLKKATTRQAAVELSKENIKLIEEYLEFLGGHPKSKLLVVDTCINVAKFIFRNDLDDDDYIDESDFPIIRRLNLLSNKLNEKAKKTPPTVSHSQKSVPWELVYPLLEKLRERACEDNYTRIDQNGQEYRNPRLKSAVFNDLQLFLSMAFMVLMPPDRSRTFYSLELRKTLVKGVYENNRFAPEDKLVDKSVSKWYIHLESEDYKTGKAYGEFWGEVHNYEFPDKTLLYDYMQKWIDEGRECNKKCNHNFFFRGTNNYSNLSSEGWAGRIRAIFYQETKVPVTPKELRKMYVTYLKDQGVSEAELEAAAWWMKHSRLMQSKIYDQQNKTNKMAPIQSFNQRMFERNMQSLST